MVMLSKSYLRMISLLELITHKDHLLNISGTVHITRTVVGDDGSVRREMRFRTPGAENGEQQPQQPHRRASTTSMPAHMHPNGGPAGAAPPSSSSYARTRPAQRSHSTSRVRPNTYSSGGSHAAASGSTNSAAASSSRPTARVEPSMTRKAA